MNRILGALLGLAILSSMGCELFRQSRRPANDAAPVVAPAGPIRPTVISYVDSDAFDTLFETALVNRDAVIVIRTQNDKPDWTGRLNAWIAAWNMGKPGAPRNARGQIPTIDGDTLREFRLLIEGVVDRADVAAKNSVAWWREERMRSRRVELLRAYSLRFHMNEAGLIELIFFNGAYAREHPQFLVNLTDNAADDGTWSRCLEISHCKRYRARLGNPTQDTPATEYKDWTVGLSGNGPANRREAGSSESSEAPPKR